MNRYLIIVALLVALSISSLTGIGLRAENRIEIGDTLVPKGSIYQVPAMGKIDASGALEIIIAFDARNIDIKNIISNESTLLRCNPINFSFNYNKLDSSLVVIRCDNYTVDIEGILFYIIIEGLAGPDSITYLQPLNMAINNDDIEFSTRSTKLRVPGRYIFQPTDNLGNNAPNPFNSSTIISFSLGSSSKSEFKIFATDGSLVAGGDLGYKCFQLFQEIDGGLKLLTEIGGVLERGTYKLKFEPDVNFSSGAYYFIMITDRGVFNRAILHNK